MVRKNGWEAPYEPLQVVSWVLFVVFGASAYPLMFGYLPLGAAVPCLLAYTGLLGAVAYYTNYCTGADPRDVEMEKDTEPSDSHKYPDAGVLYCYKCLHLVNPRSRHCRVCDKCVDVYDHHCKWLNNCVGVKTYKQFLRLLGTAWLMTLLQFAGGVVVFIEFLLLSEDEFSDKVAAVLGCTTEVAADAMCTTPSLDPLTYLILSVVVTGILGVTVGMITQLFVFHINLVREGLTTYDYILKAARERADRRMKAAQEEAERVEKERAAIDAPEPDTGAGDQGDEENGAAAAATVGAPAIATSNDGAQDGSGDAAADSDEDAADMEAYYDVSGSEDEKQVGANEGGDADADDAGDAGDAGADASAEAGAGRDVDTDGAPADAGGTATKAGDDRDGGDDAAAGGAADDDGVTSGDGKDAVSDADVAVSARDGDAKDADTTAASAKNQADGKDAGGKENGGTADDGDGAASESEIGEVDDSTSARGDGSEADAGESKADDPKASAGADEKAGT